MVTDNLAISYTAHSEIMQKLMEAGKDLIHIVNTISNTEIAKFIFLPFDRMNLLEEEILIYKKKNPTVKICLILENQDLLNNVPDYIHEIFLTSESNLIWRFRINKILTDSMESLQSMNHQLVDSLYDISFRFVSLIDSAVDSILIIDSEGIVQNINRSAIKTFGYGAEEIIGKNINILMPEPYKSQHDNFINNYNKSGIKKIIGIGREIVAQKKDGTIFPIHLSVSETEMSSRKFYIGFVQDITTKKEAEDALKKSNQSLQSITFCRRIILMAKSTSELLDEICITLLSNLQLDYINIILNDQLADYDQLFYSASSKNIQDQKLFDSLFTEQDCILKRMHDICLLKKEAQFLNSIQEENILRFVKDLPPDQKISFASIPILLNFQVIGNINILFRNELNSQSEEIKLIKNISGDIAHALDALNNSEKRIKTEILLQNQKNLLNKIIQSYPNGIIVLVDENFNFILGGGNDFQKKNIDINKMVGKNLFEIIPHIKTPEFEENLRRGLDGNKLSYQTKIADKYYSVNIEPFLFEGKRGVLLVDSEITDLKNAEIEIQSQKYFIEKINDTIPEILFIIDTEENKPNYVNKSIKSILGYDPNQISLLQGYDLLQSIHREDRYSVLRMFKHTLKKKSENKEDLDLRILHKNGNFIWTNLKILPFEYNENQEIKKIILIISDISEKKLFIEELQKSKQLAEDANSAKSMFLATMSHEIRTPLNGVLGMTSLLLNTNLQDNQKKYTEIIRNSGESLLLILNDILDFSKIESGKIVLEEYLFSLNRKIEDCINIVSPKIIEKNLNIYYCIEDDVPLKIISDAGRCRQILMNLLNNATKFTEKGEILIRVKLISKQASKVKIEFSVSDTGIGIEKSDLERIMLPFEQTDSSVQRKYGGTGLGLSISKKLVHLLGGELKVESEHGKGSTFRFSISAKVKTNIPPIPKFSGKVLILESHKLNAEGIANICKFGGLDIEIQDHEILFDINTVLDKDYKFIIICENPKFDPIPYKDWIKRLAATDINIIFVQQKLEFHPYSQSVDYPEKLFLIRSPLLHSEIYSTIKNIFQGNTNSVFQDEILNSQFSENYPLNILIAEDNVVNLQMLKICLSNLGYITDSCNNGLEAVQYCKEKTYDIIFMDVNMPEMDGISASKIIMFELGLSNPPTIIGVTANAYEKDKLECLAAGMKDFIPKPIRLEGLIEKIKKWGKEIKLKKESLSIMDTQLIDEETVEELKMIQQKGQDSLFITLFKLFEKNSQNSMQELENAIKTGDFGSVKSIAHKFKGMALNLGATRLGALLKEMEQNGTNHQECERILETIKIALTESSQKLREYSN